MSEMYTCIYFVYGYNDLKDKWYLQCLMHVNKIIMSCFEIAENLDITQDDKK